MESADALRLVNRIYLRLAARRPYNEKAEAYYGGDQPLSFATAEWRKQNGERYADFADNWAGPVVDAEGERIEYRGLKIPEYDEAAKLLHEQWLMNDLDAQSSQGFISTLTTSRSFVLVWGDKDENPVVTWEHSSNVEIEYDFANPRIRKAALKTWADDSKDFATLYTPDAVWKYERGLQLPKDERSSQAEQQRLRNLADGGWVPREVPGETWPIGNPLGLVPVVEIPNRPLLGGDPVSEVRKVIPMQDGINLLWAYMFLAADYASMPARVVLGSEPPKIPILDKEGKQIGTKVVDMKELAEKRLFYATGDNAKIDSWEAARLDVFTDAVEVMVGHVAAQTRTPPTYLVTSGGISNVNGDGLKASEIGLVKKTLEFHTFASSALREVFRLIALVQNDSALASVTRLSKVVWSNPEIRSEAQLADALGKKKAMGYPLEYLMELDGMDPIDVQRVLAMRDKELLDPQIEAATRELEIIANSGGSS